MWCCGCRFGLIHHWTMLLLRRAVLSSPHAFPGCLFSHTPFCLGEWCGVTATRREVPQEGWAYRTANHGLEGQVLFPASCVCCLWHLSDFFVSSVEGFHRNLGEGLNAGSSRGGDKPPCSWDCSKGRGGGLCWSVVCVSQPQAVSMPLQVWQIPDDLALEVAFPVFLTSCPERTVGDFPAFFYFSVMEDLDGSRIIFLSTVTGVSSNFFCQMICFSDVSELSPSCPRY